MSSRKPEPARPKHHDSVTEHVRELSTAFEDEVHDDDLTHVIRKDQPHLETPIPPPNAVSAPQNRSGRPSIRLLDLPVELLELLCVEYLDIVTCTCFGLACKALFNITEHLFPWQVNLHMRTKGDNRKCLGHLLTDWMAPKYSFDHSWGIFLPKKHYLNDEEDVERQWRKKESWKKIRLVSDKYGAAVAYERVSRGF